MAGRGRRDLRALALACALAALNAAIAQAAAPSWLPALKIEPHGLTLNAASCASASMCAAASSLPVIADGGPPAEPAQDPDPTSSLTAVSCALGTRFCMFMDANGGAFSYSSGTFSSRTTPGTAEFDSVSCPTATTCFAIDRNLKVSKWSGGSWDVGTALAAPANYTFAARISCASASTCVAVASDSTLGQQSYTYNGLAWAAASAFDAGGGNARSFNCTSTGFCLLTDDAGRSSVYNGTSWGAPVTVDSTAVSPKLFSSCSGTFCVGVDFADNAFVSTNGTSWSPNDPANIHASTGLGPVTDVSCASASMCVAVDGLGNASAYAVKPTTGTPTLSGTPVVGQTLTLAHASTDATNPWRTDAWFRCDGPHSGCAGPISASDSAYVLAAGDAGKFIEARETLGFGFYAETAISNSVGPVTTPGSTTTTTPPTDGTDAPASTSGDQPASTPPGTTAPSTTAQPGVVSTPGSSAPASRGRVMIKLSCAVRPCSGSVVLRFRRSKRTKPLIIGSARFSIGAGKTLKLRISLNAVGRRLLKQHHGKLSVTLTVTPTGGKPQTTKLTVRSTAK